LDILNATGVGVVVVVGDQMRIIKSKKICGAKKGQPSVRLILDGLSTRSAGVSYCCAGQYDLGRRYPISSLAPQSLATHLLECLSELTVKEEVGKIVRSEGRCNFLEVIADLSADLDLCGDAIQL
jgi:hypothetical protein